ncbi:HNH endonuclease signature motif containing protein [Chryseobacterium cucumeris]|uniref:HNH endonuclease signature motif containing protein n=1 Tax=Chryseobacterium cucumeris TaxID=1813611 RepID=UPI0037C0C4D7
MRANKQRTEITPEQDKFIKAHIHTMSVKKIANELNICANKTRQRCYDLGFKELLQQKSIDSRFLKGHEPMNKGVRMTEEQKERIKHTFFQKGHLPHNTKNDGEISVRKDKRGIVYMYYRVSLSKWIPLHHKIWMEAHGEIPKGYNVIFKNKDTLDIRLENLECISNADNMMRNTIHRFPEELKTDIRKLAKLKRIINKKENKNEQINI